MMAIERMWKGPSRAEGSLPKTYLRQAEEKV